MKKNQIILQGTTSSELAKLINDGIHQHITDVIKNLLLKNEKNDLLTRSEAAELLKIDLSTLWHWTKQGKIKCYGIANRRYYKRSELLSCLILLKK